MINDANIKLCEEIYVVEKTIDIVVKMAGESKNIRIEALKSLPDGKYSTRAFIYEHLTVQTTYPQTGSKFDQKPKDAGVWIDYSMPWTNRDSADEALNQALGFLLRP